MARRKLTSGDSTADATGYETEGYAPGPNALVLMFVTSVRSADAPTPPSVTGNGLQWIQVQSVVYGTASDRRLTCFRASGKAPSSGGAVFDFGTARQDFCAWSIFEYDDVDVTQANGKSALTQSFTMTNTGQSLSATLSASADPTRNVAVGAIGVESADSAAVGVTPGAGFAEVDEAVVTQFFGKGGTLQTEDAAASNTVIAWTWNRARSAAAIILEVKAAPPPVDPGSGEATGNPGTSPADDETLAERFEPVLFFHPTEKFFPSDAKRFVEAAALWTAQVREDDQSGWGGAPGAPFPRNPTVPAMSLSAVESEGGDFRFDDPLGAGNDHRFLEVGGWKDTSEAHEPGVTAQSTNRYSDRTAIEGLYDASLEPSRFWYHAEVVHSAQLNLIAGRAPANLTKMLGRFQAPTLLCYYFFFPAHDQTVSSATCVEIEAKEVSSHAGDWQCLAILGEGAGSAFAPKFLGRTGSRPADVSTFPPYQFDEDQRTAMIVSPWTSVDPVLEQGHPRLFVAAGSHSLYTTPGPQMVDPYPVGREPQYCGTQDAPTPAAPADDSGPSDAVKAVRDVAVLLAKLAAGGGFGPFGAAAALVSCVAEISRYRAPFEPFGAEPNTTSPAPPDQAPAGPGTGKTIKPALLTVSDAGTDVVDWRCAPSRPVNINGREYDCMVNRSTQKWWPNPDTTTGFNGRWGQNVTNDGLSRRAGPRFPNYPQMFLMALADGVGRTPPLLTLP